MMTQRFHEGLAVSVVSESGRGTSPEARVTWLGLHVGLKPSNRHCAAESASDARTGSISCPLSIHWRMVASPSACASSLGRNAKSRRPLLRCEEGRHGCAAPLD